MSYTDRCIEDPIYKNGCQGYFSSHHYAPLEISMMDQADGIEANNPHYDAFTKCWKMMRHSVEGQEAIREHAIEMDYVQVPPAVEAEGKSLRNYSARHHYINKAHYIEVVPRILDEVEGRIFSKPYKIDIPEKLREVYNTLDSEGLTFEQYARWCVREVFAVQRFGVLVDWDSDNEKPILKRYIAESIVNWDIDNRGNLTFVVLEDEVREAGQIFSHNKLKRRISFTVEYDINNEPYVVQRTWIQDEEGGGFEESEAPIALMRNGFSVSKIPFIFFGGVKPSQPMLKPLAASALDYFDAHASYRNSLWWACNEQPYFTFSAKEGEECGFMNPDGSAFSGELEILYGSSTPILLKNGELKFAGVKGVGLEHMYRRLKDTKAEMTGMGARSFNAQTASNIKVQTERMQQKAEGSVIGSISSSISLGIKRALELAAEWSQISGDISFELNTDYTEDFDLKYMGELIDAIEAKVMSPEEVFEYLRDNSDLIPKQKTYEEHVKQMEGSDIGLGADRLVLNFDSDEDSKGEEIED